PQQRWQSPTLLGEVALAAGDLVEADAAFARAEPERKAWLGLAAIHVSLFHNQPFRDGRARVRAARGDRAGSIEIYRQLLTPGPDRKWTAVLEPRFVLEVARQL